MAGLLIWEGVMGANRDGVVAMNELRAQGVRWRDIPSTATTNYHLITSTRAKKLNGTIYLPLGHLLIASPVTVAEESDYTVIVVNRLDLASGPNLVLNSNYARSRVPIPSGLGPLGAQNVQLIR
jgi:hypothetical protein